MPTGVTLEGLQFGKVSDKLVIPPRNGAWTSNAEWSAGGYGVGYFFPILFLFCFCQRESWGNAGTFRHAKVPSPLSCISPLILTVWLCTEKVKKKVLFCTKSEKNDLPYLGHLYTPSALLNVHAPGYWDENSEESIVGETYTYKASACTLCTGRVLL